MSSEPPTPADVLRVLKREHAEAVRLADLWLDRHAVDGLASSYGMHDRWYAKAERLAEEITNLEQEETRC